MADPYIDYVTLLLHFDGVNGGAVFADETLKSVTPVGGITTSTDQSKFGGSSGLFNGTSAKLTVPLATVFNALDFTVEFCVRFSSLGAYRRLVSSTTDGFTANSFCVRLDSNNRVFAWCGGVNGVTSSLSVLTNIWYTVAVTRTAGVMRLFVDGVLQGSETVTGLTTEPIAHIGGFYAQNGFEYHHGFLDELRITTGVSRYTANYTPDTAPFSFTSATLTYRALSGLGRKNNEVPNMLLSAPPGYNRAATLGWRNIYQGGAGRVAGTVKYTPNSPVHRKVRLIEQATGFVVREAWSDPATGAYSFDYVATDCKYTVLSYDYTWAYRAVVADGIIPEVIT